MDSKTGMKSNKKVNLKEFNELIEKISKVEYKRMMYSHLMDYAELVNIATQTVYKLDDMGDITKFNNAYISTAIKWAIRNEARRRYKWYSLKSTKSPMETEDDKAQLREAIYKTILSIDEMQENEMPTQVKDSRKTPEENLVFHELSSGIKEAIKKLPTRERDFIENKFFKNKKLRELSDEYSISESRISRIIQSGLNKVKKELQKNHLV